jgi:hypothetical protein
MPGPALTPVAATGTSRLVASASVLIGLPIQVTQIACCLSVLPIHSNLRGS